MKTIISPPFAPSLIESTRAIGYTTEAAIADIIDNSISAGSRKIEVRIIPSSESYVAILDDGEGMNIEETRLAMVYGSTNPLSQRKDKDLGRYGLGLKTASLSQCRQLTVISYRNQKVSACCWDIDYVNEQNDWALIEYEVEEISNKPLFDMLIKQKSGTLVIWEKLDKIVTSSVDFERSISQKITQARNHLSLIFHRYLCGEPGVAKITITLNNNPLLPNDPFLVEKSTIHTPEIIRIKRVVSDIIESTDITVTPYVLPHLSKLTDVEIDILGGNDNLSKNQGFYVYRNKRLIMYATWFGMVPKSDFTKLCRVKVDIPNNLDNEWSLDIKKSQTFPPDIVIDNLRRIIVKILSLGKRVYTFRGKKQIGEDNTTIWTEMVNANGKFFLINKDHPIVQATMIDPIYSQKVLYLIKMVESELPVYQIISDYHNNVKFALDDEVYKKNIDLINLSELLNCYPKENRRQIFDLLKLFAPLCNYEVTFEDLTNGIHK